MNSRHLDLGSGFEPKNPYKRIDVYGCDIRSKSDNENSIRCNYKQANLATGEIPFQDNFFDSVSAYDFLEHIPRQLVLPTNVYINPFVILMNEIYRVLKPDGFFLASTPAYPSITAFSDPTHVNFITDQTPKYFIGDDPTAKIYGFVGAFNLINARWDTPHNSDNPHENPLRKSLRRIHRKIIGEGLTHMFWEFSANKTDHPGNRI